MTKRLHHHALIAASMLAIMSTAVACSSAAGTGGGTTSSPPLPSASQTAAQSGSETAQSSTAASEDASSSNDLLAQIKKRGTIIVGTSGDNAPTIYRDATTGQFAGFDADWANAIAKSLGVKVDWQTVAFAGLIPGLASGRFDLVVSGFFMREERLKSVNFSVPYAEDSTVLVYPDSLTDNVENPKDGIKGRAVCVVAGSSNGDNLVTQWGTAASIVRLPGQAGAFEALKQKRCDVMVTGDLLASYWIQKQGGTGFKTSAEGVNRAFIAAGMPKSGSESLQKAVDIAINQGKREGLCQQFAMKSTGHDFASPTCEPVVPDGYPAQPAGIGG